MSVSPWPCWVLHSSSLDTIHRLQTQCVFALPFTWFECVLFQWFGGPLSNSPLSSQYSAKIHSNNATVAWFRTTFGSGTKVVELKIGFHTLWNYCRWTVLLSRNSRRDHYVQRYRRNEWPSSNPSTSHSWSTLSNVTLVRYKLHCSS